MEPIQQSFVAQLIYRIRCEGVPDEQYEEQWRLIFAEDERAALKAAPEIALVDEAVFADRQGRMIEWQLVAIKDMKLVDLQQGALLASTVREVAPVAMPLWME